MKIFCATLSLAVVFCTSLLAEPLNVNTQRLVVDTRKQVGVTLTYDPAYRSLPYPNGDVPPNTGVCADVIVRALRGQSIDLQKLVHEDMEKNFNKYPQRWGLKKTDTNIDHRRVPNLMTYFTRRGNAVTISADGRDYLAGDIVTWNLNPNGFTPHIGIVSDKRSASGEPLMIHNIGNGAQEDSGVLFQYKIIGHYRL